MAEKRQATSRPTRDEPEIPWLPSGRADIARQRVKSAAAAPLCSRRSPAHSREAEVRRRLANNDRHWPVWCVSFNLYGDAQPVAPDSLGELRHVPLAAEELPFAIFGLKQESLEVAEAIEGQTGDLS